MCLGGTEPHTDIVVYFRLLMLILESLVNMERLKLRFQKKMNIFYKCLQSEQKEPIQTFFVLAISEDYIHDSNKKKSIRTPR